MPAAARKEYEAALAAGEDEAGVDRAFIELKRDATPQSPRRRLPRRRRRPLHPRRRAAPEVPAQ